MNHFTLNAITSPIHDIEGLTHAVLQSIYNHGASTANDRARMEKNTRGGVWSDAHLLSRGSRDWTLQREKLTDQTVTRSKQFCNDALQWLIDERHADAIDIEVTKKGKTMIRNITITLKNGEQMSVTA